MNVENVIFLIYVYVRALYKLTGGIGKLFINTSLQNRKKNFSFP